MSDLVIATPAQLKDGSGWGVRIAGDHALSPGQTVQVETRDGKTWDTTISERVYSGEWEGEAIQIWKTGKAGSSSTAMKPPKREEIPGRILEMAAALMQMSAALLKDASTTSEAKPSTEKQKPKPAPAPPADPPAATNGIATDEDEYDEGSIPF